MKWINSPKTGFRISFLLFLGLICLIIAFFQNQDFFDWAFARHQNSLSWWIRPVMILPFMIAAWYQSWAGIWGSLIALFSSMFWFPVPEHPDPEILKFLAMEQALLRAGWTISNLLGAVSVSLYLICLAMALWRRSIFLGVGIFIIGGVLKIIWSQFFSPEAGNKMIPMAITGICLALIWFGIYHIRVRKKKISIR